MRVAHPPFYIHFNSKKKIMQVKEIMLADICPSTLNPRKTFDQESLNELSQNIKENGLVQPITVRKAPKESGKKYEIVCGERRFRASCIAGLETIQAIVRNDLDDKQAFAAMIIENLQRKDVDPMEEAAAFSKLYNDKTMKVKEIAKMLGKSTSYVISRINLSNIIPEFVKLMQDGTLYLVHLLDICKLTKAQQETLYNAKFTPESIERWVRKILPMEVLHAWIDECVMKYLDTARFSLLDESFSCGKNCEGCPLNTKNKPEEYNEKRDRCMNPSCFNKKTQEFIFREAKESGLPCIFKGQNCEEIIKAAKAFGIEPLDYTKRLYVYLPIEPDKSKFSDMEAYKIRKENFDKIKAVFDSNLKDGTTEKVYEICYAGKLSGEIKYTYSVPVGKDEKETADTKAKITEGKQMLVRYQEQARQEIVEEQRTTLAKSEYSKLNTPLSAEETKVFHAVMMKFIPQSFKKELGIEWSNDSDCFKKNVAVIEKNRNAIKREFIKTILSEKSVCYSHDLAGMLGMLMEIQFPNDFAEISKKANENCKKKTAEMTKYIEQLKNKQ